MTEPKRPPARTQSAPGARRLRAVSVFRLALLLLIYGGSLGRGLAVLRRQHDQRGAARKICPSCSTTSPTARAWCCRPTARRSARSRSRTAGSSRSSACRRTSPPRSCRPRIAGSTSTAASTWSGIARAAWTNFRSDGSDQAGRLDDHAADHQADAARRRGADRRPRPDAGAVRAASASRRSISRKMKELILAVRLERELTKAEILSIYLNHVYLGHGAYGVGAAAETYFGKEVEDLTVAEAAMLAGLVASPTKYAPHRNMAARARTPALRARSHARGQVHLARPSTRPRSPSRSRSSTRATSTTSPRRTSSSTSARLATKRYGNSDLFKGGLQVLLDARHPDAGRRRGRAAPRPRVARSQARLSRPDRRGRAGSSAARGPAARPTRSPARTDDTTALADQLLPEQRYGAMIVELPRTGVGVIVDLGPKRLPLVDTDAADVAGVAQRRRRRTPRQARRPAARAPRRRRQLPSTLAQRPALQGAIVVIEPSTGRVLAMVGGYDWTASASSIA